jgi:hypothetical protein
MHHRQRETRRRDHGPDDRNTAHVQIFFRMSPDSEELVFRQFVLSDVDRNTYEGS